MLERGRVRDMAAALACRQDFRRHLEQHFHGAAGREARIEILHGVWDFQTWLQSLGIKTSGLTATHTQRFTNHCWRFIPRADLPQYENMHLEVESAFGTEHVEDVIMITKQWVSDKDHPPGQGMQARSWEGEGGAQPVIDSQMPQELSQLPFVILPHGKIDILKDTPLDICPRNPLAEKAGTVVGEEG
jgi:hypothetical protein